MSAGPQCVWMVNGLLDLFSTKKPVGVGLKGWKLNKGR